MGPSLLPNCSWKTWCLFLWKILLFLLGAPYPQWLLCSGESLCSSVPSESVLGDTGCWWRQLSAGAQMAKSQKNREHVTQNLKLLWFCGVNFIFNAVTIFSWAVHTLRSSHTSSPTTNHYLRSGTRCYTNTAHRKSIVRECNPVTGFMIKERIYRKTKSTVEKSHKAKPDWKALVIIPMQFQFNSIRTEKLPVNDKEVFAAQQKVQIASDFVSFSQVTCIQYCLVS